jgi:hypothetical protein
VFTTASRLQFPHYAIKSQWPLITFYMKAVRIQLLWQQFNCPLRAKSKKGMNCNNSKFFPCCMPLGLTSLPLSPNLKTHTHTHTHTCTHVHTHVRTHTSEYLCPYFMSLWSWNKTWYLLGFNTAWSDSLLLMFWDNLWVPSSRVKQSEIFFGMLGPWRWDW